MLHSCLNYAEFLGILSAFFLAWCSSLAAVLLDSTWTEIYRNLKNIANTIVAKIKCEFLAIFIRNVTLLTQEKLCKLILNFSEVLAF